MKGFCIGKFLLAQHDGLTCYPVALPRGMNINAAKIVFTLFDLMIERSCTVATIENSADDLTVTQYCKVSVVFI